METEDRKNNNSLVDNILKIRSSVLQKKPLIHCLTNHITINDCANMILAAGGRPIMAEHCLETEEITAGAQVLVLNTGNITEERMNAIMKSGKTASRLGIPIVLDCVGIGCSSLRLYFVQKLLEECVPSIIKGNQSEIDSLLSGRIGTNGVDVDQKAADSTKTKHQKAGKLKILADKYNTTIAASGETDIIVEKQQAFFIDNGTPMLTQITGTGCMLGMLMGLYLLDKNTVYAGVLASAMLGIAGELTEEIVGTGRVGSFKTELFNQVCCMENQVLKCRMHVQKISI